MNHRCIAITHTGTQCLRIVLENNTYCWQHYDFYKLENEIKSKEIVYNISEIESDLMNDIDILNLGKLNISENTQNTFESELLPELENIVGQYLDIESYVNLNLYNPKTHNIARYILESDTQLNDSIKLDNISLFTRFLNDKIISLEILNNIIQNDSIEIFKSILKIIQINDSILELIFKLHAFKIGLYLSTLEQYSRRKKFFFYIHIFKIGLTTNDLILTQFFITIFKLNIKNNINEYLALSKKTPDIYNYLLQFK